VAEVGFAGAIVPLRSCTSRDRRYTASSRNSPPARAPVPYEVGMDAANPLCRWLMAAGLVAAAGCQSGGTMPIPTVRGQLPPDPAGPAAPVAPVSPAAPASPTGPVVPAAPFTPGSPVQGAPVGTSPGDAVATAGYSGLPRVPNVAELLKEGVPQIKVVALVGSSGLVTDQEVIEAVRQRLEEFRRLTGSELAAKEKELYAAELRRIIERELIIDDMYAKLKKNGKLAAVDEIKEFAEKAADQTLRAIRKGYGLTSDEEFQTLLRAQGLTVPVIRRQIERQMIADEYVRSAIKEKGRTPGFAEIRAYYERRPDEFKTQDKVKWLDIFVSVNRHPTPRAAYDHAEMVRREAASGADFVALVKRYDNGLASGSNGVGVGSKRGEIQPADVEPAVWALKTGEVSGLIETPVGYHIVKVAEREYAGVRAFDAKVQGEIREKLMRQYREAEYQRLVEELWRKGGVRVIDPPSGEIPNPK
jgi:peptidyl-prolyl cis-trans isomerase SurA